MDIDLDASVQSNITPLSYLANCPRKLNLSNLSAETVKIQKPVQTLPVHQPIKPVIKNAIQASASRLKPPTPVVKNTTKTTSLEETELPKKPQVQQNSNLIKKAPANYSGIRFVPKKQIGTQDIKPKQLFDQPKSVLPAASEQCIESKSMAKKVQPASSSQIPKQIGAQVRIVLDSIAKK
jgi:hypothetical protein